MDNANSTPPSSSPPTPPPPTPSPLPLTLQCLQLYMTRAVVTDCQRLDDLGWIEFSLLLGFFFSSSSYYYSSGRSCSHCPEYSAAFMLAFVFSCRGKPLKGGCRALGTKCWPAALTTARRLALGCWRPVNRQGSPQNERRDGHSRVCTDVDSEELKK